MEADPPKPARPVIARRLGLLFVLPAIAAIAIRFLLLDAMARFGPPHFEVRPVPSAAGVHFVVVSRTDGLRFHVPEGWVTYRGWPAPQPTQKPLDAFASTDRPPLRLAVFETPPLFGGDPRQVARQQLQAIYPLAHLDELTPIPGAGSQTFETRLTWDGPTPTRGFARIRSSAIGAVHMVFTAQASSFEQSLDIFRSAAATLEAPNVVAFPGAPPSPHR